MQRKTAKFMFYEITECGYYTFRKRQHEFCTAKDAFTTLYTWIKSRKSIYETATFEPEEDSDDYKVYCYEMEKGNSFVLTTWNASPDTDGQIAAINGLAQVGASDVRTSNFPDGYIAGYETYFWIIPEMNVLVTIRFDRTNNGQSALCKYVDGFLRCLSPYVIEFRTKKGEIATRYGATKETAKTLRPAFATKRRRLPGKIEAIKARRAHITKIIQKTKLTPLIKANDTALWQAALARVGMRTKAVQPVEVDFDTEFAYTPSKEELEDIITAWETQRGNQGSDDVGFRMRGNANEIEWLGRCLAKGEIDLNVHINEQGIIRASSLLEALEEKREWIINSAYPQNNR
ncbi:hypothetical protein [Nitratidesulfovibrio sp. 1201_IL3209]|uniref:hypothetical protein n=1 Tax=Nitratidesulfovibrio sp. 1201_IL3209 TaxID=3084053 RepID=UPI002FD9590B